MHVSTISGGLTLFAAATFMAWTGGAKQEFNGLNPEDLVGVPRLSFLDLSPPLRHLVVPMHRTMDESAQVAADFARRIVPLWQAELGSELLGAYLMGSLAHGGFSRRYSDIDIAVVTELGLSTRTLDRLRSTATALSPDWGSRLSVFWTDRHFSLGRFPPLDRVDYLDHGVVLMEHQRVRPARPSREEIQRYLADAPFANWTALVRRFGSAEILEPKDRKAFLRTLLYPARFCYSWTTGRMASNDDAVAFLREECQVPLDLSLITGALQCRQGDADPDPLFPARTSLLSQVDACATLLAGQAPAVERCDRR
jgi:predicted nucleotidyltransferase